MTTKSQKVATDIGALMRSRAPLLWVVTREEQRAEQMIIEAAAKAGYTTKLWDAAAGITGLDGKRVTSFADREGDVLRDCGVVLDIVSEFATPEYRNGDPNQEIIGSAADKMWTDNKKADRNVWVMRDLPGWLQGQAGMITCRQLRNLARQLPRTPRPVAQSVLILSPSKGIPAEIAGHATVIDWPLPDREEIAEILDAAIDALPENLKAAAAPNGAREAAIDAAVGLSGEEAAACYAKCLVQTRRIDPAVVAAEKKRIVTREGLLEWYDPIPGGLEAVGGLENVKAWLKQRASAYTLKAREYGLPSPKGIFLVGVSGCGKSLIAKAIATFYGIPLLRVDLGALKDSLVGKSEANLRRAFEIIAAIGRCVVWFDEVEKALQGATSGSRDGGVSADALGAILTWMQEKQGEAFVVATANDIASLPPELLRKGRFDDVFFVDLPNKEERPAVLSAALTANGRTKHQVDTAAVGNVCVGMTGAEIAAIVPDAMFIAFNDGGREVTTNDLIVVAKDVVPLSKTAAEKITALRTWATGRARPASKAEVVTVEVMKERARRILDMH
jgi:ATPase family associated with various cellular activities (AAA)